MQLGAVYYLVKPFTFAALREQLESYRQWRERLASSPEADQGTVDALYGLLRSPAVTSATRSNLPPTMARVLDIVRSSSTPLGAADVAQRLGFQVEAGDGQVDGEPLAVVLVAENV
jgi:response regulator of citrate/malate metabolism